MATREEKIKYLESYPEECISYPGTDQKVTIKAFTDSYYGGFKNVCSNEIDSMYFRYGDKSQIQNEMVLADDNICAAWSILCNATPEDGPTIKILLNRILTASKDLEKESWSKEDYSKLDTIYKILCSDKYDILPVSKSL